MLYQLKEKKSFLFFTGMGNDLLSQFKIKKKVIATTVIKRSHYKHNLLRWDFLLNNEDICQNVAVSINRDFREMVQQVEHFPCKWSTQVQCSAPHKVTPKLFQEWTLQIESKVSLEHSCMWYKIANRKEIHWCSLYIKVLQNDHGQDLSIFWYKTAEPFSFSVHFSISVDTRYSKGNYIFKFLLCHT